MICWMTALALLLTAVPALAVQGDAIIARYGLDGFNDSVRGGRGNLASGRRE